jgi:Flp pilus assembly protein TadD
LVQADRVAEGVDCLRRAVDIEPANPRLHFNLAQALLCISDFSKAIAPLAQAAQLNPNYVAAWEVLGGCYQKVGDWLMARQAWEQSLKLEPNNVKRLCDLADVLESLSEDDEAEHCYRRAIALDSKNVRALNNLAIR